MPPGSRRAESHGPSVASLRGFAESPRVVFTAVGVVAVVTVVIAVLLVRMLLGGGGSDGDARSAGPAGSGAESTIANAEASPANLEATDPEAPEVAAYAAEVLAEGLTLGDGPRELFLRMHTTPEERARIDELLGEWQRRVLLGLGARNLRSAGLNVTVLGHRARGVEPTGADGEEEIVHLLLLGEVSDGSRSGPGSTARFLAAVAVVTGDDGPRVDGLPDLKVTRARVDSMPDVFYAMPGGSS